MKAAERQWELLHAQCYSPSSSLRLPEAISETTDAIDTMAIDSPCSRSLPQSSAPSSPASPVSACLKTGSRLSQAIPCSSDNESPEIFAHKEQMVDSIRTDDVSTASPSLDGNGSSSNGASATQQAASLEIVQQTSGVQGTSQKGKSIERGEVIPCRARAQTPLRCEGPAHSVAAVSRSVGFVPAASIQIPTHFKPPSCTSPLADRSKHLQHGWDQSKSQSWIGVVTTSPSQSVGKASDSAQPIPKGANLFGGAQHSAVRSCVPSCGQTPPAMMLHRSGSSCGTRLQDTTMSKTPCASPLRSHPRVVTVASSGGSPANHQHRQWQHSTVHCSSSSVVPSGSSSVVPSGARASLAITSHRP